eukprot:403348602
MVGYFVNEPRFYGTIWYNKYSSTNSTGHRIESVVDLGIIETSSKVVVLMKSPNSGTPSFLIIALLDRTLGKPIRTWYFDNVLQTDVKRKSQLLISQADQKIIILVLKGDKQYIVFINSSLTAIEKVIQPVQPAGLYFTLRSISNVRTSDSLFIVGGWVENTDTNYNTIIYGVFFSDGKNSSSFTTIKYLKQLSSGYSRLSINMLQFSDQYVIGCLSNEAQEHLIPRIGVFILSTAAGLEVPYIQTASPAFSGRNQCEDVELFTNVAWVTYQVCPIDGDCEFFIIVVPLQTLDLTQSTQTFLNNILLENFTQNFSCNVEELCTLNIGNFILDNCKTQEDNNKVEIFLTGTLSTDIASIQASGLEDQNVYMPFTFIHTFTPTQSEGNKFFVINMKYCFFNTSGLYRKCQDTSFQVKVVDKCITEIEDAQDTYTYRVGSPKAYMILQNQKLCNQKLDIYLNYTNQLNYPSLVTLDQLTGLIYVEETRNSASGTYLIKLFISSKNINPPVYTNKLYEYTLIVVQNTYSITNKAPYFLQPILAQIYLGGKEYQYQLPISKDDEGDIISTIVLFDQSSIFAKYDKNNQVISLSPSKKQSGDFTIQITLSDNNLDSKQQKYEFKFKVIASANSTNSSAQINIDQEQILETNQTNENNETVTVVQSSFITPSGIKIDNSEEKTIVKNKKFTEYITARIYKVSNTGYKQYLNRHLIRPLQNFKYLVILSMKALLNSLSSASGVGMQGMMGKFYLMIIQIANFQLIQTDEIYNKVYKFNKMDDIPLNLSFEQLGYQQKNMIINLGFLYSMMLLTAVAYLQYDQFTGDQQAYALAIFCIIVSFVLPFASLLWIYRYVYNIKNPILSKKVHSLLEDIDTSKFYRVIYYAIYLSRRLMFCMVLVYLENNQGMQICLNIFLSYMIVVYLIVLQPFEGKSKNNLETVNEIYVLIITYSMMPFSDAFDIQYSQKEQLGFMPIAFTLMFLLTNFSIIIKQKMISVYKALQNKFQGLKNKLKRTQIEQSKNSIKVLTYFQ